MCPLYRNSDHSSVNWTMPCIWLDKLDGVVCVGQDTPPAITNDWTGVASLKVVFAEAAHEKNTEPIHTPVGVF